ncbi:MAG: ABC transporter ATP-binding protein [Actinomycetota bacterium]
MSTSEPTIEVHRLTKRFGSVVAVDDLSFSVAPGTVTGLLGHRGAGKTTTLRLLLGLATPTSGWALTLGRHYQSLDRPLHKVGAVLERSHYHPGRRALRHLEIAAIGAGIHPQRRAARIEEVLEIVGLGHAARRKVGSYSPGMRRRLGLATALLADPLVLILDEPANGLDPEEIMWLRRLLRSLADQGKTVLVSCHLLGEFSQMADEVVVIDRGRLVRRSEVATTADDIFLDLTAGAHEVTW